MNQYQALRATYGSIQQAWLDLSARIMNSDPSLPEYADTLLDSLSGMKACFSDGAIEASTLRFLAQTLQSNIMMDESLVGSTLAADLLKLAQSALDRIPPGPIVAFDYRRPTEEEPNCSPEPVQACSAQPGPAAVLPPPERFVDPETFSASWTPAGGAQIAPVSPALTAKDDQPPPENANPVLARFMRLTGQTQEPPQPDNGTAAHFVIENLALQPREPQLECAELAPAVAGPGDHDPIPSLPPDPPMKLPEVAGDMPGAHEKTLTTTAVSVSVLAISAPELDEEIARELDQLFSGAPVENPLLVEDAPEAFVELPSVHESPEPAQRDESPSELIALPSLNVETIHPAGAVLDHAIVEQQSLTIQPDETEQTPSSTEAVVIEPPAQPESIFTDPQALEWVQQVLDIAGAAVRDFLPDRTEIRNFDSLPDDLRPASANLIPMYIGKGPAIIVPRSREAVPFQEITGLRQRLGEAMIDPFYAQMPFIQYLFVANRCLEETPECFDEKRAVSDSRKLIITAAAIGKLALLSPHLISTPFGIDLYETAMRLVHTLDAAPAELDPGSLSQLDDISGLARRAMDVIERTSAQPNTLPYFAAYAMDWLSKILDALDRPEPAGFNLDVARDLSIALSTLLLENYGLEMIETYVYRICAFFTASVKKPVWSR